MRVGETRTLLLPPQLISGGWAGRLDANLPDATLQFQITLLEVLPGVEHEVLHAGAGRIARPGDAVEFNYVTYVEGRADPCDDSATRGRPLRCRIGDNQLIPGWELGLIGMAEGEKRVLVIPPYLAYGARGAGALIPPDATLSVEIELLRILSDTTSEALLTQRPTLPRLGG
ncbi:MAG: FKBP-type peptidyl-prolyl cis-trans isomerase [Phycisphaeraceae bacterium]|nr:FKBP-type peptidyl-prolyl cis-trans isomerase [Phycisphaeraceae bacterium]